jgi:hypothetical protein
MEQLLATGARVDAGVMIAATGHGDPALLRRLVDAGGDVNASAGEGPLIFEGLARRGGKGRH